MRAALYRILGALFIGVVVASTAAADDHCLFGCPKGGPTSNIRLTHTLYTASYNVQTKFSDWVAYVVTAETLSNNGNRDFHSDPDIPANERLEPADFKDAFKHGLKYEIGHQAPLNSLGDGPHWQELNYLSNVTPQKEAVNSGVWRSLESWEEKLIKLKHYAKVYVVTGPLYLAAMPALPDAHVHHIVPSSYWKVVAVKSGDHYVFGAFVIPQSHHAGTKQFCDYGSGTTIDAIELASGLDLFSELLAAEEHSVESAKGGNLLAVLGCH